MIGNTIQICCYILQKINTNGQDIDLSLPITSTYLRRMRAFGLGFDSQHYQTQKHQHHGFEVCVFNGKCAPSIRQTFLVNVEAFFGLLCR